MDSPSTFPLGMASPQILVTTFLNPDICIGDIELEDLPVNYEFPLNDSARAVGTTCLTSNED
jgi:hypothetical protein